MEHNQETKFYLYVNSIFRQSRDNIYSCVGIIINNAIATHAKENQFTALLYKELLLMLLKLNTESGYSFLDEECTEELQYFFSGKSGEKVVENYKNVKFVQIF